MANLNEIEDHFKMAHGVTFHPSRNYQEEPPVIIIGFDNPNVGIIGYNMLIDTFSANECTLIIHVTKKYIDLSIVNLKNAETVNIKNLKYDQSNLRNFENKEPTDRHFVILIGNEPTIDRNFIFTRENFSPLILYKYAVLNKPL